MSSGGVRQSDRAIDPTHGRAEGFERTHRSVAWRVAFFVGAFPVISETFILRQITGLLDLGHEVDIYADMRQESNGPVHPSVREYGLLERATFMDLPPETVPYEMPVWPITGRTWSPGAAEPVPNWRRVRQIFPAVLDCLAEQPALTCSVLRESQYGYRARSLSGLWRLARLLSAAPRPYNVLHAHFGPVAESFRFARELYQAPLIVTFHGYDYCAVPRKEGKDVYRNLFAAADAVTVNSDYTGGRVRELGCPGEKIHNLPMGIPVDAIPFRIRTRARGEPFRLLTVARLVPIKGHEYVLRALALCRERLGPVEYHVVGDGPLRGALETLSSELGLGEVVRFEGACDESGLMRHYRENHIFILPSVAVDGDAEGQGLVLQEAQAAGLPVVATRHGALPEGMVDGESGFLVPERDAEAMAATLVRLAEQSERWPAMGQAGRDFAAQHYDSRLLNRRLVELYRTVLAEYLSKSTREL